MQFCSVEQQQPCPNRQETQFFRASYTTRMAAVIIAPIIPILLKIWKPGVPHRLQENYATIPQLSHIFNVSCCDGEEHIFENFGLCRHTRSGRWERRHPPIREKSFCNYIRLPSISRKPPQLLLLLIKQASPVVVLFFRGTPFICETPTDTISVPADTEVPERASPSDLSLSGGGSPFQPSSLPKRYYHVGADITARFDFTRPSN